MKAGFMEVDDSRALFYAKSPANVLILHKGGWEQYVNYEKVMLRGEYIDEARAREMAEALGLTDVAKFGETPAPKRLSGG